jgi:hypothetical protein
VQVNEHYETTLLRTAQEVEEIIISVRLSLYNQMVSCGPAAVRRTMDTMYNVRPLPSERTIARILAKHGLTYGRTGWYQGDDPEWLPESAKQWKP